MYACDVKSWQFTLSKESSRFSRRLSLESGPRREALRPLALPAPVTPLTSTPGMLTSPLKRAFSGEAEPLGPRLLEPQALDVPSAPAALSPSSVSPAASPCPSPRHPKLEPLAVPVSQELPVVSDRRRSQDSGSPLKGRLRRALTRRHAKTASPSSGPSPSPASRSGTDETQPEVDPASSHLERDTEIEEIEGRPVSKSEREKWDAAFAKHQQDGELHVDDVKAALVMCGFDVRDALLSRVLEQLTRWNTLDRDEFSLLVCRFEVGLREAYESEFNQLDTCGAGTMDVKQLELLLRHVGQTVRRATLEDLVKEVDDSGRVGVSGFQKIQHLIRKREGFTTAELESFAQVFRRFDRDDSETMSCSEFASALTWLGFPCGPEKVKEFHQTSASDGQLSEGDFVRCLRRVFDDELQQVESFLKKTGQRCTGDQLKSFVHGLGYSSSPQAILDALSETNWSMEDDLCHNNHSASLRGLRLRLSVDDVCKLLSALRACDGFTQSELQDLKEAFKRNNPERKERISAPYASRALRWLGHGLPLQELLQISAEVDVDGGHWLDFSMFIKLARKCNERDQVNAVAAFKAADTEEEGVLTADQQKVALLELGCLEGGRLPLRSASEMDGANLRVFLGVVERFKKSCLPTFRKNQGFSSVELEELQTLFETWDRGDGSISKAQLVKLIEALFPRQARCREFRPFLVQLLQEQENASLTFEEVLKIARKILNQEEEREILGGIPAMGRGRFEREVAAIKRLRFSVPEANQFRDFFLAQDMQMDRLQEMFDRASQQTDGCEQTVGFVEFLQVMRDVAREGWFSQS
ncbi:unnamed protein product [Effrenium voratum]|uniref:Calmodulin n=1 Tax=Effrenium voratum TaxID=2562239 RepID=A0AA36IAM9_9DINO|nr:unnamed protein product [Effrenium voratum]